MATPAGTGALGIVRLSGASALELLRRASLRRRFPARELRLCRIRSASGEVVDQVLACYQPGPASYTGEDTVEIFAHGGTLNLRRVLARMVELGARPAEPGEFTRRAFLNGRIDLTQAEAVARIIEARSERALRNAQALHSGGLRAAIDPLRAVLLSLAAELEAAIDFAEEVPAGAALRGCTEAEAALAALAESYRAGSRLDRARVGLVGEANVGKSSLFNRLLGRERALVAAEAGTTRDYLEAEVEWQGHRLTLLDSAGVRAGEAGALEREGQRLAEPELASCDLLLAIRDLTRPSPPPLPPGLADLPRIEVGSKADLVAAGGTADALRTSAATGEGVEELRRAILDALTQPSTSEETVLVTEERQVLKLARAREELASVRATLALGRPPELAAEHLRTALRALAELTGELSSEAILDQVFARFCIGK